MSKNQELKTSKFISRSRVLIVDPVSATRNAVFKIFKELGVSQDMLRPVGNYSDAVEVFKEIKPNIIVSESDLDGHQGFELLALQRKEMQNRLETAFFLLSKDNSPLIATHAAEYEIDSLIVKPFTMSSLGDVVKEVLTRKMKPTMAQLELEKVRILIEYNKLEDAQNILNKIDGDRSIAHVMHCYQAQIFQKSDKRDEAREAYEAALLEKPNHYRSLVSLWDLALIDEDYSRCFELLEAMSERYPISPKRIPEVIRLFIRAERYDDVIKYLDVMTTLEINDPYVNRVVSAGLLTCGKNFLMRSKRSEAVDAFKKVETYANEKDFVRKEIIATLYREGMAEEARVFLTRANENVASSPEVKIAEVFLADKKKSDDAMTIQMGLNLIQKGIHDPTLFVLLIQKSIVFGRRPEVVEELVQQAVSRYPEKQDLFKSLFQNS